MLLLPIVRVTEDGLVVSASDITFIARCLKIGKIFVQLKYPSMHVHTHARTHTQMVLSLCYTMYILTSAFSLSTNACLFSWRYNPLWLYFHSPVAGFCLLVFEVSWSHTTTRHSRQDSYGQVINPSQKPLPDDTQHLQQTNNHAPDGIRTHDLSRRAAEELRLRPRGHWDRQPTHVLNKIQITRVGTLIVATIYLQLIQNRYMFRSFTVLQCSHQHCVQPAASDVEVVGYL